MTDNALIRAISGDTKVAGTPSIAAPGALYAVGFFASKPKSPNRSFSRPFGRETALRGRPLTKTEEEDTIIINRSGRSTYPEQNSVLRSGATPPHQSYVFLLTALGEFLRSGRRLFDSQAARERFAAFPDVVTVYRGSIDRETIGDHLGVSWTLNRDIAIWFATQHPFRNRDYAPVLLTGRVNRGAIAGFLVERHEDEVLIVPDDIFLDSVEALPTFLERTLELEMTQELLNEFNETQELLKEGKPPRR